MKSRCILVLLALAVSVGGGTSPEHAEGPVDGTVRAFRASHVNAQIVGSVAEILVEEGQKVDEGQVMLRLDDTVERANHKLTRLQSEDDTSVKRAEARLAQAERDLTRTRGLVEKGTVQKVELEQAQYIRNITVIDVEARTRELDRLKALAALREAELNRYVVRAPFSGTIMQKLIELGENTYPLDKRLFHLIDTSKVYVEVNADISLLKGVAVGRPATVTTAVYPGKTFPAVISFISPTAVRGGWARGLKVLVENPEGLLRPEMKAAVAFFPARTPGEPGAPAGQEATE